jgi:glycosyltransferase involved in cell wall biosynthesis
MVSVIMAVYNDESGIHKALCSLTSQTFKDIEIIVIDDGSSDGTRDILMDLAAGDERIKLISQSNMGLTKSLNKGVRLSTGKYIARMDSDDISHTRRLEEQVKYLENKSNVALLATRARIVFEGNFEVVSPHLSGDAIIRKMRFTNCLVHSSVMIRSRAFTEIGMYDESFDTTQDYDAWSRLIDKGYLLEMLPDVLVTRNVIPSSVSRKRFLRQSINSMRVRKGRVNMFLNFGLFLHQFLFGVLGLAMKIIRSYRMEDIQKNNSNQLDQ